MTRDVSRVTYSGSEPELVAGVAPDEASLFAFFLPLRAARFRGARPAASAFEPSAGAAFLVVAAFLVAPRLRPRAGFCSTGASSATADGAGLSIVPVGASASALLATTASCGRAVDRVPTTPMLRMCAGGAPALPIG